MFKLFNKTFIFLMSVYMNEVSVKTLYPVFMLKTHQHTGGQPKLFEYSNKDPGVTLIIYQAIRWFSR